MIGLPLGWLCTPLGLSCTPLIMQHQTAKKSAPPMRQGCAFVSESPALFILENGGIGRHTVLWSGEGSAAFFVGSSPTSPAKIILVLNVD